MKNISKTMCIALLATGIALFSFNACTNANAQSGRANAAQVERWEYKIQYISVNPNILPDVTSTLNSFGMEGWELVSVNNGSYISHTHLLFTFKRRLP